MVSKLYFLPYFILTFFCLSYGITADFSYNSSALDDVVNSIGGTTDVQVSTSSSGQGTWARSYETSTVNGNGVTVYNTNSTDSAFSTTLNPGISETVFDGDDVDYWYEKGPMGVNLRFSHNGGRGISMRAGSNDINNNSGYAGHGLIGFKLGDGSHTFSFDSGTTYSFANLLGGNAKMTVNNNDSSARLAIKIGSYWYASSNTSDDFNNGKTGNEWYKLDFDDDANLTGLNEYSAASLVSGLDLSGITHAGIFLELDITSSSNSQNWGLRSFDIKGMQATAIPEPSTYGLILGCLTLFFVIYIRRKKH